MSDEWPVFAPEGQDVPLARPVTLGLDEPCPTLAYGTPPSKSKLREAIRAVAEIFLLLPAGLLVGVGTYFAASGLGLSDKRWLYLADGLGTGFGCVLGCFGLMWLAGRRLASIGLTSRAFLANVGLGLVALLVTYLFLIQVAIAAAIVRPELLAQPSAAQQAIESSFPRMPFWAVLIVCALVSFWEEVIFRGFVLTRLHVLLRRWWLTILAAALVFGSFHIYEGWLAVVLIMFLASVMSGLFVWRKSLVPSITYHFVHNFVIFQLLQTVSTTWK